MICNAHGANLDLQELRQRFPTSLKGTTLAQLMGQAAALNMLARPVRLEIGALEKLKLPCVLHWDLNHFVVLKAIGRGFASILDPAVGERRLPLAEVSRHFTGVAVELSPAANFQPEPAKPAIGLRALAGRVVGLRRSLIQIFTLAAVLELFALTAPIFNQLVVDDAIATHDRDLLGVLIIGFAVLLAIQICLGVVRSWMVMALGQNLALQWLGNVFAHLIRLPANWFQQRHMGDIISRFGAVREIQRTMTQSMIEAVLDGLMAVASLVMMWLYSPLLTAVVVGAVALYAAFRYVAFRPFQEAAAERLVVASRENTHFIETLRAITTIKLFGREQERRARWQNLLVDVQNRDVRTAKMNIAFSSVNAFVLGAENLLVFWLGARLVMAGGFAGPAAAPFTIGMLFAFVSYKAQFSSRMSALVDYAVEIRMLRLHSERLADIVLSPAEPDDVPTADLDLMPASLELRAVSFRYGEGEPWLVKNLDLRIEPGESVAITGASGCGKTTLLKILLGLLRPTEGVVLFGGVPVGQLGLGNFRRQLATVMQEDSLLAGNIADNITFFDPEFDMNSVQACAVAAGIHDEIIRMPMGYHSLVGDMGSSLSGGQKQRVLLARALYKRPRVLALDEATSHLDVAREREITSTIAELQLTRIVIAHRPDTLTMADRVLVLRDGTLSDALSARTSELLQVA